MTTHDLFRCIGDLSDEFIEEAAEIDPAWFEGAESVGICGATSTPKWLMQEVADRIGKIGKGK